MTDSAPLFIKLEDYKDIIDLVTLLRAKITECKGILARIAAAKAEEDAELDRWAAELDEMGKRLELIDRSLLRP